MVGRDGNIAGGNQDVTVPTVEAERHAALGIATGDDEGRGLDELELHLRTAGVGAAGAEGRVEVLEDNAFAAGIAEFLEGSGSLKSVGIQRTNKLRIRRLGVRVPSGVLHFQ